MSSIDNLRELHAVIESGDPANKLEGMLNESPTDVNQTVEGKKALDVALALLTKCYSEGEPTDGEAYAQRHAGAQRVVTLLQGKGAQLESMAKDRIANAVSSLPQVKALCAVTEWSQEAYSRAMFEAVDCKRPDVARFLAEKRDGAPWRDADGCTPFLYSLRRKAADVANALWETSDRKAVSNDGRNAFDFAVASYLWKEANKLHEDGLSFANPDTLLELADNGAPRRFARLLESDAKIDWTYQKGNVTILDRLGQRAAMALAKEEYAEADRWLDVIFKIKEVGGTTNTIYRTCFWPAVLRLPVDKMGRFLNLWKNSMKQEWLTNALVQMVRDQKAEKVKVLIDLMNGKVDESTEHKITGLYSDGDRNVGYEADVNALHLALRNGWEEGARLLLPHADAKQATFDDKTAFQVAIEGGLLDIARDLYLQGIGLSDKKRDKYIEGQVRRDNVDVMRLFLELGVMSRPELLSVISGKSDAEERQALAHIYAELTA